MSSERGRAETPLPALSAVHTVAFDFDGVFTDNTVWVGEDGRESVRCSRADGLGFDLVRAFQQQGRLQAEFFILSKEQNPVVQARARKLKLACHQAVGDKLRFIEGLLRARLGDIADPFAGLVYVGNDLNDLPLMRRAGYAVAPADAHPMVRDCAHLVLERKGGAGCVRELLERLLGIGGLSARQIDELVSG